MLFVFHWAWAPFFSLCADLVGHACPILQGGVGPNSPALSCFGVPFGIFDFDSCGPDTCNLVPLFLLVLFVVFLACLAFLGVDPPRPIPQSC